MPILAGIDYEEAGSGPAAICLHGIGGDATSFAPQLGELPLRVISWSMPGYRQSLPGKLTFGGLSGALERFMDALGLDDAHIVGHSIGGMIAQDFALRHPARVRSLALIGTTPAFGGRDPSFAEAFLKDRLAPLDAGMSMAEMARAAAPLVCGPDAPPEVHAAVERPMANVPEPVWRDILACLTTFNRREETGKLTMPACLIAGTEDRNAPAKTMEKMAAAMPDAEYHLIEGAGHMINQEAPEKVNAILSAFYGRLA